MNNLNAYARETGNTVRDSGASTRHYRMYSLTQDSWEIDASRIHVWM